MDLKTKGLKELDVVKALAWMVLIIIFAEWFPYFIQLFLNFFNVDVNNIPVKDMVFMLAFLLSPLFTLLAGIVGRRHQAGLRKAMRLAGIPCLILFLVLAWLVHSAFYQYYPMFAPDLTDITTVSDVFGILEYMNPGIQTLMLSCNAILFFLVVPVMFVVATDGTSVIHFSKETNYGVMMASGYMIFRFGSIAGTSLRLAFLMLITGLAWILYMVNYDGVVNEGDLPGQRSWHVQMEQVPKYSMGGLGLIMGLSLALPAMMSNGFLNNSWIWFGSLASAILGEVFSKKIGTIKSKTPGLLILAGITALDALIMWSSNVYFLIAMEPFLEAGLLFWLALFIPFSRGLFGRSRKNVFLKHRSRQLFFSIVASFMLLVPLLVTATFPPLSNILGILVASTFSGLGILMIFIGNRKK
ncbi:MAG: hypothetical protein ACTSUE_22595 [Promethearchaeota archaeon]